MVQERPDPNAPVYVQLRASIAAPLDKVWKLHTSVASWPSWQRDISESSIDGPFESGSTIHWQTAGLDEVIPSRIAQVDPQRRTLWGGTVGGIQGVHEWRFLATGQSTQVETEESWAGAPVSADPARMESALRESLERWLKFLADAAVR